VTGQDVIHSFYVPQFFYKKDAIPGRINTFQINITEPGTYGGQCAEFCGLGHDSMYFTVRAVTPEEFAQWAQDAVNKANETPPPAPSGAAGVDLTAVSITEGFKEKTLTAPADAPFTINFQNADPSAPHNIAIKGANPDGTDWIGLPPAAANTSTTDAAPPLKAGTYPFYCAIHPNMVGTLTVGS
jgi:heme/copper-type cytochrome/quinol oxidase subunit 2